MFCRQQVAELAENIQHFEHNRATLAVIGSGDPEYVSEFRKTTGYEGLLFSDPSLAVFSFLGFSKRLLGLMGIRSVFKAVSALRQGHRQGPIQGSALQLGGAVVIDVSGVVRYFFSSRTAGDHPHIDDLIKAAGATWPAG